jgi:hypothetical protein
MSAPRNEPQILPLTIRKDDFTRLMTFMLRF